MAVAAVDAPSDVVDSLRFSFYTPSEIRRLSVKKITIPEILDGKGMPVPGGLYDPALGPVMETDSCKTCGQLALHCPGHCGHIDLAKPLYNPLLFYSVKSLLHITCFFCHKFRFGEEKVQQYVYMLKHIANGDILAAKKDEFALSGKGSFSRDDEEDIDEDVEMKSAAVTSCGMQSDFKDEKQKTWTSLQHTEAIHVLSNIMKNRPKKCANCGRSNPSISSPTFGWLSKTMKDVSASFIRGPDMSMPFTDKDRLADAGSGDGSQRGEELSAPSNVLKNPEYFRRMYSSAGQKHLVASEAEVILQGLWRNEAQLCTLICDVQQNANVTGSNKSYTMFFLKALLVPPSKFRPPAFSVRGVVEHPQNLLLSQVLETNIAFQELVATDHNDDNIIRNWMTLQRHVNVLFDSSKGIGREKETTGIRQLLEKKTGILRQKMMGKRVNFACRSVISPDPYLAVNEIGIPPYFALKLTYPERVTPWNVNKLRHAIINGSDIHPGASHYMDKDRSYKLQVPLSMRNAIARKLPTSRGVSTQSAKGPEYDFEGKIVFRHLQDGDIVLVNRQPTLHKPSMMAHVVRVLQGEKTIRMHYANCSTYNADFDGDEMNVHLPQDEISRAEAINIVNANKQYIVPTTGDPIRGLIQDHIISAVLLSKKDTFFTREVYHQLLYASCVPSAVNNIQHGKFGQKVSALNSYNVIQPQPPAILKPKPLWTGKQVITAILCHITRGRSAFTIEKDGRIPKEYFAKDSNESRMYIQNNEFIHGMIDKAQFVKYGLVHIVHELYGADTAGSLLSIFSRLCTTFLQIHGFTCGLDDLLLLPEADMNRKALLEKSEAQSKDVHVRFTGIENCNTDSSELHREIEKVIRSNGESGTARLDRMMSNSLNVLTSDVNKALFPAGLQKPFPSNCLSLMTTTGAKGGLVNLTQISSLLGQQELEGKRVPRMISGKTLPCFCPWDTSGRAGGFISDRFLTGLRPQEYYFHCMAGRDGLVDTAIKTSRSGYLQRCLIKNLESLKVCYDYTVRDADGSVIQFAYGEDGLDVLKASYITELEVLSNNQRVVLESLSCQVEDAKLSKSNIYIKELPNSLREAVTSLASHLSKSKKGRHHRIKRKDLMKLMKLKYISSLADPGEAVGVIAAQSIGEPSTQMTLNTFHLAGRGEMNVTLGIPRLQEILMSASESISTPIMTCPLLDKMTKEDGERLAARLRRICVADIVESMNVSTVPFYIHQQRVSTLYKLRMKLYSPSLYPPHTDISLEHCRSILRTTFVNAVEEAISKHIELICKISDIEFVSGKVDGSMEKGTEEKEEDETGRKSTNGQDGGNNDEDEEDDGNDDQGADAEKRKKQKHDEMEYEDEMEKQAVGVVDDFDGETHSGFESEVDQAEAEEDFEMGRDGPSTIDDEKMDEDEHGTAADEKTPDNQSLSPLKDSKSKSRGQNKSKGMGQDKTTKGTRKKMIRSTVFVEVKGLKFEAHFVLSNEQHILLAEIAQKTAKTVYIKQSKNIDRCSVLEPKRSTDRFCLQTAGVNFLTFWDLQDVLDINKVVSNDIHAMLKTYGVEAARATIINEVKGVFESYGICVNARHLSLIADFMTANGGYRPMNRLGMLANNTSPFSKMTFETATRNIVEAAFHGERDVLQSPSASVCLGQPVKYGTGCFDLLQNF